MKNTLIGICFYLFAIATSAANLAPLRVDIADDFNAADTISLRVVEWQGHAGYGYGLTTAVWRYLSGNNDEYIKDWGNTDSKELHVALTIKYFSPAGASIPPGCEKINIKVKRNITLTNAGCIVSD